MIDKYEKMRSQIKATIKLNPELNQKIVALNAGITDAYLSQLLSGVRKGDDEIFSNIAKIVGIECIWEEGTLTFLDERKVPFPRYMDIMAMPIPKRPWAIKSTAAETNGIHGWNESSGDEQLHEKKEIPREHQRYFNGEITEIDLYNQYDRYFKKMVGKLDKGLKKEGL